MHLHRCQSVPMFRFNPRNSMTHFHIRRRSMHFHLLHRIHRKCLLNFNFEKCIRDCTPELGERKMVEVSNHVQRSKQKKNRMKHERKKLILIDEKRRDDLILVISPTNSYGFDDLRTTTMIYDPSEKCQFFVGFWLIGDKKKTVSNSNTCGHVMRVRNWNGVWLALLMIVLQDVDLHSCCQNTIFFFFFCWLLHGDVAEFY